MSRHFNTAGPCDPRDHYMLPPERRIEGLRGLIDQKTYFVVHAPRQAGKTTAFRALAQSLTAEGRYCALLTSCETGQLFEANLEESLAGVLDVLRQNAELHLPPELRPPPVETALPITSRLRDLITRWAQYCPRPVVLFLDEIDALLGDALVSVLRQLRSGYAERPHGFPQTVALIGLRDVRDYRTASPTGPASLGTSSPFNIKVESLTLRNFTAAEVAELYDQHTAETSQPFLPEAKALAFELTGGQPWLVNALAREAVEKLAVDRATPVTVEIVTAAKEALIARRDTHLDSLVDRLREPRVRRILEPILAGELLPVDALDDDVEYVRDLGLIREGPAGLTIANPIYREVIPRALTFVMQQSLPVAQRSYAGPEGRLRFAALLEDFRAFWAQHAEAFLARAPYSEAAAQLVFMAFLQKIVNGGGFLDREFAVGSGRVDLCLRWPYPGGIERFAMELKVWRDRRSDPLAEGRVQLAGYLERLGLDHGTLLLFDARAAATPLPERNTSHEEEVGGRKITVVRL
jgi:hypothetical protein